MTTIVAGEGLGLASAVAANAGAAARLGQGGGDVFVNAANGNLVLQVQDEWLSSTGLDVAASRTYNSQGLLDDDNGDNWRIGLYRGITGLSGTVNAAGSSVIRVDGDGARRVYAYDTARAAYVNGDGGSGSDILVFSGATSKWTWTDGDSRASETYDWSGGAGKLLEAADADGNKLVYAYTGSLLTLVTDASGEKTYLDYSGNNLTQVRLVKSDGSTSTKVRYGYDASNRLSTVTVDLSPDDNSIADGKTYVTTYTYDGTSRRVASVAQSDGTSLAFTYVQVGSRYCVASVTDALGRVTTYGYAAAAWGAPATLESLGAAVHDPQVKLDAAGNGFALWRENGNLWASRFDAASGAWQAPVNLSTRSTAVATPQLGLDASGNAVVAWVQSDGTANTVYASRYAASGGAWTAPVALESLSTAAADPQVAVNAAGKAIVVWRQPASGTSTPNNLYASRFDGSAWSVPTLLETNSADITGPATVALDAVGNASVAWLQDATANVYLARYTAASNTWSTPSFTAIETGSTAASNVQIAFDEEGNGQVIYIQGGNLVARSYSAATNSWGTAKTLENATYAVVSAQLSVNARGDALVTWVQSNGTANNVYARRSIAGTWLNNAANADTGDLIETLGAAAANASGAIADNGDAVVLWRQPAATGAVNSVYASRFMAGAWQAAELVESGTGDVTQGPAVAIDAAGGVQALWQQSDGTALSIHGARFVLATTTQTDASGLQARYVTDSRGRLAAVQTPAARQVYANDASGNLIRQTDSLGRSTVYEYDANGNLTLSRDALGSTVSSTYGSKNELLTETTYLVADPDGAGSGQPGAPQTVRYAYDAENHLRFEVSAAGRVVEYRYNAAGQRVSTLDYAGNLYDVSALVPTATLSEATLAAWAAGTGVDRTRIARTDTSYDFRGQVASETDYAKTDSTGAGIADGTQATTQYTYDPRGRLLQRISPRGVASTGVATDGITSYTYDGLGRVLTSTDSLGNVSLTQYDAANRKIVSTAANGLVTTSVFDAAGQLLSLTQTDGAATMAQTRYWYDAAGRLGMVQDATGVRQFTLYDTEGRVAAEIDGNGSLTEYTRDADGRPVRTLRYATALSGSAMASLVDAGGNPAYPALASVRPASSSADIAEWTFYDAAGRVAKTVDGEGAVEQNLYDGAGQLTEVVAYASTVNVNGITTATLASDAAVSPSAHANDRRTRHFYDADGLQVATLDAAGYLSERQYDGAGRLVHTIGYATQSASTHWLSGTLAQLRPSASAGDVHAWQLHDGRGLLAAEVDGEGHLTEYLYDADGRKTQQVAYANKALVAPASITAATTLGALRPASNSQDQATAWTYTELGQVATVTDAQGTVTRHTYDSAGNLVKTDAAHGTSELRSTQARYDRIGRVVAELGGRGSAALAALGSPTQAQIDALWSQYGTSHAYDQGGRRVSTTDAAGNRTLYYYDADGQIAYTVNPLGEVAELRYDALGRAVRAIAHGVRIDATTLAGLDGGLVDSAITNAVAAIANAGLDSTRRTGYDRRGLATSQIDALGNTDYLAYNAFGEQTYATDRIDASTTVDTSYTRDKRGLVTQTLEDVGGLRLTTSAVYDAFGRAVQSTDARGMVRSQQYDRLGRVVQATDAAGTGRSTSYDAFDRVLTQTDGLGNITRYAYDKAARSMTVTTPEGVTVVTRTNRHGQVVSVTDGLGQTTTQAYDADGRQTGATDALGRTGTSSHDTAGRLFEVTDSAGTKTRFTYDAAGRVLTRSVDPSGLDLVTRYQYDAQGRVSSVTDPSGVVTQNSYDLEGRVTQVAVDPIGLNLRTTYAYDAQGRTVSVTSGAGTPAATTVSYAYDKAGRRVREAIDPAGLNLVTQYQYDGSGNVVAKTDAAGNVTRYAHDEEGRLVYTLDPLGGVTRVDHDAEGRVTAITRFATPASGLSTYTQADFDARLVADPARDQVARSVYDKDGRQVYTIDALGHVVHKQFDANGRVLQTTAHANPIVMPATITQASVAAAISAGVDDRVTRHVYDAAGQERYVIDALGYVTAMSYDAAGRRVGATSHANATSLAGNPTPAAVAAALVSSAQDRSSWSVYDGAGRLAFAVDAEGFVTRFGYDDAGRSISTTRYPASVGTLASPPSLASLQALLPATVPATAAVTGQGYDTAGRLLTSTDGEGIVTRRQLDALGRTTSVTVGDGRPDAATTAYSHDAAGRVKQSVQGQGSLNLTTRYLYDALGRQTGVVDPRGVELAEQDTAWAKAQRKALGYLAADGSGKLAANLTPAEKQALLDRYTSRTTYDASGRKTQATDALGNTTQYRYDAFGQLVKVTDPRGNAGYFYHDRLGRQVLYVDPMGSGIATAYNFAGEVVSQTRHANAATGSWSEAAGPAFTADDARDATTLTRYDRLGRKTGQTDAEGFVQSWTHDGLDNVVSHTNALGGVTTYTHDRRGLVLTETLPITSRNASGVDTAVVNRHAYDARGNRTQSIEAFGLPEQRTTTFTYDEADRLVSRQGTSVTVVDAAFNAVSATPTETYTYDARGNRIVVDLNGRKTFAWYDAADRKIAAADAMGTLTKWTLDAAGNAVQQDVYGDPVSPGTASVPTPVNAANVRTAYSEFDANNRLARTWQVADNVYDHTNGLRSNVQVATQNSHDASGNVVRVVDPNGNSTWIYHDKAGRKVMQVDAEGYVVGWGYDAMGNVTAERKYAGRLSASTRAGLSAASDTAALRSELIASPDVSKDRITTYAYDRMGRQVRQGVQNVAHASVNATTGVLTEATGEAVTRATYNGLGGVLTATDANGGVVTSTYDLLGRETRKEQPGFTDHAGNTDVHQATETAYNGLGQVVSRTDKALAAADDRVTRYAYNANGWMTTETDPLGNVTRHAYDVHGNRVRSVVNRLEAEGSFASGTLADTWDKQTTWIVSNGAGGNRTVLDPVALAGASGSLKPYLADWSGDGRTDVLWFDANSGGNRLYLDNGDGTFQVLVDPIAAADLAAGTAVHAGDFNGDGKTDLVWWDKATGNTRWFSNNGNGSFTRADNLIAATDLAGGTGLYLADFNGDGRLDALWWDQATGNNTWFTRNADGSWTKAANRIATAEVRNGTSLLVADFNGDGRADVMWYDRATGNNLCYFANADGTLTKVTNAVATADLKNGTGLHAADWTGNGTADLLWYDSATRTSRWYQGTSSRSFTTMANPIASGAVSQAGNQRFGDLLGNGLVLRDETRFVYDAMNREVRRDDVSSNVQQNTRYDAYGAVTGKGFFGQWTETTEYDRLGRAWRTSSGDGIAKAYVYDANGNATLTIQSAGAALGGMTLAQMMASSDVKPTIAVYDKRNQVVEVIEPQMSFVHEDAAIQSVQVAQGGDPFTSGLMLLSNGAVTTEMTVTTSGATRFVTFKLTLPSTAAWGDGDLEVQVVRADGPHVGTTTHVFANTVGSITLPQLAWGQYFPPDSYNPNPRWVYDQTIKIKVVKKTDFGSVLVSDETRKYYLYSGQQTSLSGNSALPRQLHFKGQPLAADNVRLKYRPAGSTGAYTEALLPKYQINGSAMAGWFAFDWSALAVNTYEYVYEAIDADNGNKVLNRVSGSFVVDGANTAIQSQTAQGLDPVYVTQLQWVITGQQSETNQVRRSQQYNAFGEVTAEIDGLGRRTDFSYNALGKLLLKTDPETSVTLANGYVTRTRPQTKYFYDKAGQVVGTQDANGNRTTMRYTHAFANEAGELQGQVAQEYFADGGTRSYLYDEFGQLRKATDQLGRTTLNGYDKNGNLVTVNRPGANDDAYQYDVNGNRTGRIDALGNRETWRYDSQGRITQAVSAAGRHTGYDYNWVSNAWATTNADDALSPTGGLAAPGGWLKLTTYGDGRTQQELSDAQDRLRWKRDLGGKDTLYAYNEAGWLSSQTNDRGQNISYAYYDNGNVKSITDLAATTVAKFEYDAAGNRIFEGYTSTPDAQGNRTFFQYSDITYDELNRTTSVQSADYRIDYEYDAVGNRRHMRSHYHDGLNGNAAVQDYWYLYDSMNRFVVTMGSLSGGRATDAAAAARVVKGTTGVDIQYDLASQRRSATYGSDGHKEDYAYDDDGFLTTTSIDGVVRAVRTNDALGRVANYKEYNAAGSLSSNVSTTYDKDGKTFKVNDNLTSKGTNYAYLNDGTLASTTTYGDATTVTTTYTYEWFDSAKEKEIKVQASNQSVPSWKPGYSKFTYDVNGKLQLVQDVAANRSLRYVTSGEGQVLRRQELVGTSISKTHNFYFANGVRVGDVGNDGQSQEDYAQDLARQKNLSASEQNKRYRPQAVADFDQNYEPINSQYPGSTSGSYVVRSGDTLQGIARAVWGDGSLWYLIADANGLGASSTLVAGQTLVIPNKVTNIHNNATTFSVYQPGSAIGDVGPTLPEAPAPQVKKSARTKKSGGCGKVLLGILVAVVAVVATVVTAGAFMVAATPLTMSAGPMAMLGAGASAVSGGAAGWAGVGAAMLGAAAGSAIGQGLSVVMGLQEKFSWAQVASSALTAGTTAGISKLGFLPKVGLLKGRLGVLGNAAIGGAANSAASQLATKFVNPQTRFNWTAVAGAAIGGAIGAQSVVSDKFAKSHPLFSKGLNTFVQNAATQETNSLLGLQPGVSLRAAGVAAGKAIVDDLGKATYVPLLSKAISKESAKRFDGVVREVVQEGVRWGLMGGKPDLADFWKETWGLARSMRPHAVVHSTSAASSAGSTRSPGFGKLLATIAERTLAKAVEEGGVELGRIALSKWVTHKAAPAFSFSHVAAAGVAGGLGAWAAMAMGKRHPNIAAAMKEGLSVARGQFFNSGAAGGWSRVGWAFADGMATKGITVGNEWAGHALYGAAHSAHHHVRWRQSAMASMGITALGRSAHLLLGALRNDTLSAETGGNIARSIAAIALGGLATGSVIAYKHKGAGAAADAVSWIDGKLGASGAGREAFDRFTGEFAKGQSQAAKDLGSRAYSEGVALVQQLIARSEPRLVSSLTGGPQMLDPGSGGADNSSDYEFKVGWQTFKVRGGSIADRSSVEDATREVLATPRGHEMLDTLQSRWMTTHFLTVPPFYIDLTYKDKFAAIDDYTIAVDPRSRPEVYESVWSPTGIVQRAAPEDLRAAIAHELGHAVMGAKDDGPRQMNNVNQNENPVRRALGMNERSSYRGPGDM